jgi:hypothetical protein
MAFKNKDHDIDYRVIKSYGIFSEGIKSWNKEVNLVSWNKRPAKLDIRSWKRDHSECGKGITLNREEAEKLLKLLNEILKQKPGAEKKEKQSSAKETNRNRKTTKTRPPKKPEIPKSLEPFYKELNLKFGSGPDECKTARNILLQKYHPDKNADKIASATRKTIKIKEAYDKIIGWWKANNGET